MGFFYASAESLNNIKFLSNGQVLRDALKEDIEAIQNEIDIVLKLRGLEKDKKKDLEIAKEETSSVESIERNYAKV